MAVWSGFFDFDAEVLEATGQYDREYNAGDFTGYFGNFIGSGVCVYKNPDSMRVSLEGRTAWIAPGYLFIEGYWLSNVPGEGEDPATFKGYSVPLPESGQQAIIARLDLARSIIELAAVEQAESYPNSLVLALVDAGAGTVTDLRGDGELCGLVEALGDLSSKVAYAVNYIDNEVEQKLQEAEEQITAQGAALDQKIAEVEAEVEKLVPPPVGTVKFAAKSPGDDWLPCDGRFVSGDNYPELAAALGKLIPSGDQFQLLSQGEIGPQISNGAVYGGRLWVYSYSAKKLYGVDLSGAQAVKEISLTSTDSRFNSFVAPSTNQPLALSIAPSLTGGSPKIFLGQVLAVGDDQKLYKTDTGQWPTKMLLFGGEFSSTANSISMDLPFQTAVMPDKDDKVWYWVFDARSCVPYVVSNVDAGEEWFYCVTKGVNGNDSQFSARWNWGGSTAQLLIEDAGYSTYPSWQNGQRVAYSHKNKNEAVSMPLIQTQSPIMEYGRVVSTPKGTFTRPSFQPGISGPSGIAPNALNVVGQSKMMFMFSTTAAYTVPLTSGEVSYVQINVNLPGMARVFVDGAAYLWGKDIYMIFVGTGILFSRTLEAGSFGYLDTTDLLGTVTQWGFLDYSQDEGELYLLGQDTTNQVKVAKMELNTLFDYATDGAWLPSLSMGGIPGYIKAKPEEAV